MSENTQEYPSAKREFPRKDKLGGWPPVRSEDSDQWRSLVAAHWTEEKFQGGPDRSWSIDARQAETPFQGTEEYVWHAGLQKGLRDGKSALVRAIHSLECMVQVLVTSTVVDAVRGAYGLRLVSSWAQRAGVSLCQQGGMAAGPCGVRPGRGRETVTGLGLRL